MEQEILALETQWVTALLNSDADTLEKMYADGIIYIHTNAATDTKATYVEKIRSRELTYATLDREEIQVHIFGSTAIATCRWMALSVSGGKTFHINARYSHVYAQIDGQWLMVEHQSTPIA